MKWFKNLNTELEWLIEDESQIKRLRELPHFEEIDKPTPSKKKSEFICEICGRESASQRAHTAHMRMAHEIGKDGEKIDTSDYNAVVEKKEEKNSTKSTKKKANKKKKATKKTKKEDGEK